MTRSPPTGQGAGVVDSGLPLSGRGAVGDGRLDWRNGRKAAIRDPSFDSHGKA